MSDKVKFSVSLELYPEDAKGIFEKMAADGADLKSVLENFLCDLILGKLSGGSDECDLARRYYNRRGYGTETSESFLQYLLRSGELETFIDSFTDIQAYSEWITAGEDYTEQLKQAEKECDSLYGEWVKATKAHQSKEKAFQEVENWHRERENFLANSRK